jgi:predicted ATPase
MLLIRHGIDLSTLNTDRQVIPVMGTKPQRIERLAVRNYKSIEKCEIELGPITILVGRNGAGKSNIIDALRFVSDALRNTLEYAFRERGTIKEVRRKSPGGRPTHPGIEIRLRLTEEKYATYLFRIAAVQDHGFKVDYEKCDITDPVGHIHSSFLVRDGTIVDWTPKSTQPAVEPDRLLLVSASGLTEFRPVYDILTRMAFHNLNPDAMKLIQRPEPGVLLAHDGRNLASVIKQMQTSNPRSLHRVHHFLQAIGVPITAIKHKQAGAYETIEVKQELSVPSGTKQLNFDAIALSDGTIRALGILVSLFSANSKATGGPLLVGIEEPETALHPAAAAALMEALTEGSQNTQLIVTCHSPDLLEHDSVQPDMIRPVLLENGRTVVGQLSPAKANLLSNHLSTAGELLRLDQLEPDPEDLKRQRELKGTLWESVE